MIKTPKDLETGNILESNSYGQFEVVEYVSSSKVIVRFLDTDFETFTTSAAVREGRVKDLMKPSVYGVGFLGVGYLSSRNGSKTKAYNTWVNMLKRCYGPKPNGADPTYAGCEVDKAWHNYQVFASWYLDRYFGGCELDKDIKVPGNKIYGPETCLLVTKEENRVQAAAKHYTFNSPEGEEVKIYNLVAFSREHGLDEKKMHNVLSGASREHKGWTAV